MMEKSGNRMETEETIETEHVSDGME